MKDTNFFVYNVAETVTEETRDLKKERNYTIVSEQTK